MTDHALRRQDLLWLGLALLALSPGMGAPWIALGAGEALLLAAMPVWFFARKWVDVRIKFEVVVGWKEQDHDCALVATSQTEL